MSPPQAPWLQCDTLLPIRSLPGLRRPLLSAEHGVMNNTRGQGTGDLGRATGDGGRGTGDRGQGTSRVRPGGVDDFVWWLNFEASTLSPVNRHIFISLRRRSIDPESIDGHTLNILSDYAHRRRPIDMFISRGSRRCRAGSTSFRRRSIDPESIIGNILVSDDVEASTLCRSTDIHALPIKRPCPPSSVNGHTYTSGGVDGFKLV